MKPGFIHGMAFVLRTGLTITARVPFPGRMLYNHALASVRDTLTNSANLDPLASPMPPIADRSLGWVYQWLVGAGIDR